MAFRGQHEHSLDSKDRITVPARFRAQFADGVVLSAGFEPCVDVYTPQGFSEYERGFISRLNPLREQTRKMRRWVYASSEEAELDSAGRVRLPRHLIEHAGLDGPCVIVGVGDHLEIWSETAWAPEKEEVDSRATEMAESLAEEPGGG